MVDKNPLSVEEVAAACDIFFPLMSEVRSRMPEAEIEDVLKVMENVAKLAHHLRQTKKAEAGPFGFNKEQDDA